MKVVIIILSVIMSLYLLRIFCVYFGVFYRKAVIKKLKKVKVKEYPNICILLPALREQSIVDSTYLNFSNLKYPKEKIKVVFVTTEREEFEYKIKGQSVTTTSQLINKKLKDCPIDYMCHIHYPFEKGNKSSQLNYAIDKLLENKEIDFNTYIGVFDFDSVISDNLLEDFAKVENLKHADIIQPVPFFLKNVSEISKQKKFFVFTHAMFQNVRALGIETFRLALQGKHRKTPIYCMGASCFIKTKALIDTDKFPFVDDIQLGFRMLINKKKFAYLPTLVEGDLPNNLKAVLKQSIFINKGNYSTFIEVKRNLSNKDNRNIWGCLLVLWEGISVLSQKTFLPYLILMVDIHCLATLTYIPFVILTIIAPILHYLTGLFSMQINNAKKVNLFTVVVGIFCSIFWPFFLTYGALKNIQLSIKSKLTKTEIKFGKTER